MSIIPLVVWLLQAAPIDALVQQALRVWDVPGAAVVIVTPDKMLHLKGYGVRRVKGKEPVTPDTVFPLASCSKAFTTALAASLADEGKLSWDDPVRKHLPHFHLSEPAADSLVTLRDLASHRTGVAGHDLLWYRSPLSQADLVRRAAHLPLARPFRTEMQYQSIMYVALGQAVARAGGHSWEHLLTDRLLRPLGMSQTTLTTLAVEPGDRATGYRPGKDGQLSATDWYPQPEPNPAGSVNTCARDLAAWLQLHLNNGRHRDRQVVSAAGLRELHTPQAIIRREGEAEALSPDTHLLGYGLGWVIQDHRGRLLLQHTGLIDGFRVHLTVLPKDGLAWAILANREGTRMNLALSNALIDLLLGLPPRDWNEYYLKVVADAEATRRIQARREELIRRTSAGPSVPRELLAGEYENAAYGKCVIRREADSLVWTWGPWKASVEHQANDTFRLVGNDERLQSMFVHFLVEDGQPVGFRLFGVTFRRSGPGG